MLKIRLPRLLVGLTVLMLLVVPVAMASAAPANDHQVAGDGHRHYAKGHWEYEVAYWDPDISPEEGWLCDGRRYLTVEKARDLATIYELKGYQTDIKAYFEYDDE